jgi:HSP20 family protein
MNGESQRIPVRVYDRDQLIILAAPLPGLEPENISVTIAGNKIVISGEERGPRQHGSDVKIDEWSIGPYYREISVDQTLNGKLANATYGNGVLVLSIPKTTEKGAESDISFKLHPIGATRGEWIGHIGSEIHHSSSHGRSSKDQVET